MKSEQLIMEHWAEVLGALLILVGFFIALVIQSSFLNYLTIFLAGLLGGRMLYEKHRVQPIFPFILIVIGFLLGFMLGAITANKIVIFIVFLMGIGVSYWAHKKGHVDFFSSDGFIR
jgi:uncharacterized membrane protein YfcA